MLSKVFFSFNNKGNEVNSDFSEYIQVTSQLFESKAIINSKSYNLYSLIMSLRTIVSHEQTKPKVKDILMNTSNGTCINKKNTKKLVYFGIIYAWI